MIVFQRASDYFHKRWTRLQWYRVRNYALDSFSVSAPAGLALLDSNLRVVRVNDAMANIVGVAPQEMIGEDPNSLIPQIAPSVVPILRCVSRTRVPALNFPVEGETRAKPGISRHWTVSVFPVKGHRRPAGYIGAIVVENTDRLQLQLLAEAECAANIGSWEWNLITDEVLCSQNLRRMLGLDTTKTTFPESQLRRLVHPEDRGTVRTLIHWAMKDRQPYEYQARFLTADGRERILFTRGLPVLDSVTRAGKRVGFTQDITERVEASRALLESEERYRDLVENSHDLICTHDLTGRVLWMNDLPAKILGYSADELVGHRIPEMLAPELSNQFDEYLERVKRDGHAEGVMQLVARSGERRFWEYRNTLRTDGTRSPIVRGMAHDITERMRTEKSLRMFRTLIDQSNDAFEVVDANTLRFVDINERECSNLGYSREELLQLTIFDIDPTLNPADFPKASDVVRKRGSLRREGLHRRKDGTTFPVEVNVTYVPLGKGYFVAAVRDITERRRADEALRRQTAIVQELFETAQLLSSTLELKEILDVLNLRSMALVGVEGSCAGLLREGEFSCDSFFEGQVRRPMKLTWPPGAGIPGWVLQNQQAYCTNDALHDPMIAPEVREALSLRNVLCVPIFDVPRRNVIAFVALHNKPDGFGAADAEIAQGIATVASIAIQNALTHRTVCENEAELHRLSARLMTAQEQERKRIALGLHEETAQDLAGLKMIFSALEHSEPKLTPSSEEAVDHCKAILQRVFEQIRTLAYGLYPPIEVVGLRIALVSYIKVFRETTGIDVTIEVPEDIGNFTSEEGITLFRITQEALLNVLRHSGSSEAKVRIRRQGRRVKLEIEDSGKGMPSRGEQICGLGITGMKERVRHHGGTLEIETAPGKGFKIRVEVPVCGASKARAHGVGRN